MCPHTSFSLILSFLPGDVMTCNVPHCKQPVGDVLNPRTKQPYKTCDVHGHRGEHSRPRAPPKLHTPKMFIGKKTKYVSDNAVALLTSLVRAPLQNSPGLQR